MSNQYSIYVMSRTEVPHDIIREVPTAWIHNHGTITYIKISRAYEPDLCVALETEHFYNYRSLSRCERKMANESYFTRQND